MLRGFNLWQWKLIKGDVKTWEEEKNLDCVKKKKVLLRCFQRVKEVLLSLRYAS